MHLGAILSPIPHLLRTRERLGGLRDPCRNYVGLRTVFQAYSSRNPFAVSRLLLPPARHPLQSVQLLGQAQMKDLGRSPNLGEALHGERRVPELLSPGCRAERAHDLSDGWL